MLFPSVLDERLICLFKYWDKGILQGMRLGGELYTLLKIYPSKERLKAYSDAQEQIRAGESVCITVSKSGYSVWIRLRSPDLVDTLSAFLLINQSN